MKDKSIRNVLLAMVVALVVFFSVAPSFAGSSLSEQAKEFVPAVAVFFGVGLLGMFAHFLKKWTRGEIAGGPIDYLVSHPKHTVASILTFMGATAGLMASGQLDNLNLPVLVGLAFTTGWTIDSGINKGPSP